MFVLIKYPQYSLLLDFYLSTKYDQWWYMILTKFYGWPNILSKRGDGITYQRVEQWYEI